MKPMLPNIESASVRRELSPHTSSNVGRLMKLLGTIAASAIVCCGLSPRAVAQSQSANAAAALNGYNNAFLVTSGNTAYYKKALNNSANDGSWTEALDIEGEEDAYEVTGSAAQKTLVNNLCTTFLVNNPTNGWSKDPWNDDIGWMTLVLARGYQMTGNANFLNAAEYGFNMAFSRGWDTVYNGGGIWEIQPQQGQPLPGKNPLACDSLGKTATIIYQATGNTTYLNDAEQIYNWVWGHLFVSSSGLVCGNIDVNGVVNTTPNVYNQGTFADYANLLYECGAGGTHLNDAENAINYVINHETTGGIVNNSSSGLNTWADDFARALGHVCRYTPSLWSTYYPFMANNANAIWNNRRTDYNITWNGWAQQTPINSSAIPTVFVSAIAMLQFTPATQPSPGLANGTYKIINLNSGLAVDVKGLGTGNGSVVQQYGYNGGNNQRWTVTLLSGTTYKIIGVASGRALDVVGNGTANGTGIDIFDYTGAANQKWSLTATSGGNYRLTPANATSTGLDVQHSATTNSALLEIWGYSGGNSQQWSFQAP